MFNLNRLNSAMGRSIRKDFIHFSNPSSEIQYGWQVYPDNKTVKSKPTNTDERYKHTNFYLVSFELEGIRYYYRGHTVNSASWRLNEHFTSATQNPSSKFHRKLALTSFDKVTIQITETGSFSCRSGAEMHEMHLLEQDLKKYNMLNIRHRKKEVKEIQVCDTKQISKEDFKKITDGKPIEVHVANNERLQRLQLRYTVNGKRQCREVGYARCGLEEGMKRAETMKREIESMMSE